jgi:hypothetical protein
VCSNLGESPEAEATCAFLYPCSNLRMSVKTQLFVGVTTAIGLAVLWSAFSHWQSADLTRFLCYLVVAILASGLKVQLPGIDGTMSVNFLFILLGVVELSLPETLVIGCTATLVQSVWQARKKLDPVKVVFNVFGMMANASALCYLVYHRLGSRVQAKPVLLMVAALTFFLANTLPVSIIISLTEHKPARKIWSECYFWSFPYYMVGAAAVGLVGMINERAGWQTSLLVLPLIYWVYRSYRLYLARLEAEKDRVEIEKRHVEEIASLNMRTIEALALAIEAKPMPLRSPRRLGCPRTRSKRCGLRPFFTILANSPCPSTSSTSPEGSLPKSLKR